MQIALEGSCQRGSLAQKRHRLQARAAAVVQLVNFRKKRNNAFPNLGSTNARGYSGRGEGEICACRCCGAPAPSAAVNQVLSNADALIRCQQGAHAIQQRRQPRAGHRAGPGARAAAVGRVPGAAAVQRGPGAVQPRVLRDPGCAGAHHCHEPLPCVCKSEAACLLGGLCRSQIRRMRASGQRGPASNRAALRHL